MSEETKTITVNEFKMWLEGVEEMQPDDWAPDSRQWARIRAKIDSIAESSPQHTTVPSVRNVPAPAPVMQHSAPPVAQFGGSLLPRVPQTGPQQLPGPFSTESTQIPVKTPNIDTQGKPYESAFA